MILQTGMRTDLPAFYSKWFMNRVREGFVLVRNPYNELSVTKYRLSPDVVDLIGFCTKNPAPMLPYMEELHQYGQYWFVTITPYGEEIEENVPDRNQVMQDFIRLSKIVGIPSIGWRYDPILINETYTVETHIREFEKMAETLSGYTDTCIISFVDLYQKVLKNYPEVKSVGSADRITIGKEFANIGKKYGITIKACGEGKDLGPYGVDCSGCMTIETYEKALGTKLMIPSKRPLRNECACLLGNDIGQYNTCAHFCKYCYANYSRELVIQNMKKHDEDSPFLIGGSTQWDVIHEAEQKSYIDNQLSFLF